MRAPLIVTRWLPDVPAVPLTAARLCATGLTTLPLAVVTAPAGGVPPLSALAALVVTAAACTALGFVVLFALLREVGPDRTLAVTFISPVVAVASGATVLGEPVSTVTVAALGTIVGGYLLATASGRAAPGRCTPLRRVTTRTALASA